jgi:hypothetical protein
MDYRFDSCTGHKMTDPFTVQELMKILYGDFIAGPFDIANPSFSKSGEQLITHMSVQAMLKAMSKPYENEKATCRAGDKSPLAACGRTYVVDIYGPREAVITTTCLDDKTLEFTNTMKGRKVTCHGCIEELKKRGL